MKYKFSKNLLNAFQILNESGFGSITATCKNDPNLGRDSSSREINSWITILISLVAWMKNVENIDYAEAEPRINHWFSAVPQKYQDAVYAQVKNSLLLMMALNSHSTPNQKTIKKS